MEASSTAVRGVKACRLPWRFQQLPLPEPTKLSFVLTLVMIWTIGIVYRCFYNLYLHPLRKIPSPKLAAMTSWPDFYYNVVKDGSYLFEIKKMHENYGEFELLHTLSKPDQFPGDDAWSSAQA